jgi:Asp-tRNA(Asn)/Glu-tRNA(Gln) amidotransferase A subunit family amidase
MYPVIVYTHMYTFISFVFIGLSTMPAWGRLLRNDGSSEVARVSAMKKPMVTFNPAPQFTTPSAQTMDPGAAFKQERIQRIANAIPENKRQGATVNAWVQTLLNKDDAFLAQLEKKYGLQLSKNDAQHTMPPKEMLGRIVAAAKAEGDYGDFNSLDDLKKTLKTADNTALENLYTTIAVPYEQKKRTERADTKNEENAARKRLAKNFGGNLSYAALEDMSEETTKKLEAKNQEIIELEQQLGQKDQLNKELETLQELQAKKAKLQAEAVANQDLADPHQQKESLEEFEKRKKKMIYVIKKEWEKAKQEREENKKLSDELKELLEVKNAEWWKDAGEVSAVQLQVKYKRLFHDMKYLIDHKDNVGAIQAQLENYKEKMAI